VESPSGWDNAQWNYYELVNGKLVLKLDIDVKYRKPVRQEVVSIKIKVKNE
jgi:hypothetical protein